jgi:VIT1/CCC1 family predicted Fe2+/Mn2+ transporter
VIHIVGVVVTELREGGGLVSAMFTGRKVFDRKPVDDGGATPDRIEQPPIASTSQGNSNGTSMSRLRVHSEHHLVGRIGWLRAAVLGANDGIVSTASLIVGVAAAAATQNDVLLAGVAGLVAGAMSMAAGEYVSVSSQSDTEQADLARERKELSEVPAAELDELAQIYVKHGVDRAVAVQVAQQLMAKDALAAAAKAGR